MKKLAIFAIVFVMMTSMKVEAAQVKLGIDRIDEYKWLFSDKRVGLITNQTGVNSQLVSTIDIVNSKTRLTALFSPEHGIRGAVSAGVGVESGKDKKTSLPVFSLYGKTKKPTDEMLKNIDILCYDIQDVGVRTYTYIYTMAYALQACAEQDKEFVIFDRPNPLGGEVIEGPILKNGFQSFIGMYNLPMRYAMTVGELASFINKEYNINAKLTVIPMQGWQRKMYWQDTGLQWVMTSPNIPTAESALLYCGIGILGPTNISDGVGTTKPFELVGAAWIDGDELENRLNSYNLPGVRFRLTSFIPRYGNFKDSNCEGVQIHITDYKNFRAVKTAVVLLYTIHQLKKDSFVLKETEFGHEFGEANFLDSTDNLSDLFQRWEGEANKFREISSKYYMY